MFCRHTSWQIIMPTRKKSGTSLATNEYELQCPQRWEKHRSEARTQPETQISFASHLCDGADIIRLRLNPNISEMRSIGSAGIKGLPCRQLHQPIQ